MSVKCWNIENNTGKLIAGSKNSKAFNDARYLLKRNFDLEFQVNQKHIIEALYSDKEIKCFVGTNTGNFKVMYILSEEQLRLFIEEALKFSKGEEVSNARINEILEMKNSTVIVDAENIEEETEPEIKF